jgi:sec-independent protein translocase protein TatC
MPLKLKERQERRRYSSRGDPDEYRMTLGEHIGELRDRLVRIVLVIAGGWIVGWIVQPHLYISLNSIVEGAVEDYRRTNPDLEFAEMFRNITEPFLFKLKLSFMIGLGIALPYIVLQIWGFVSPGLKPTERKPIKALAPISVLLFFMGCAFCWWVLPTTFRWFLGYIGEFEGVALFQEAGSMVFFTLKMMLAFGIGFQLPLVVFIAGRLGIVGPDTLIHYWRHAIVFVFLTSAVLTPSGDVFTLMMMAVPLSILLMLSIVAVKVTARKQERSSNEELNDLD